MTPPAVLRLSDDLARAATAAGPPGEVGVEGAVPEDDAGLTGLLSELARAGRAFDERFAAGAGGAADRLAETALAALAADRRPIPVAPPAAALPPPGLR